eukprot:gnl/Chilomastix_cuspidata/5271.p2 GENE.gnl/Chilomastix_cuspidata/5271~~gnl/Chilomastix_cuspidata/5271.p2  ORF type:complete len:204 (-),score=90.47 gnl/Chilomastix_cuspidata/5271:6-617(-)
MENKKMNKKKRRITPEISKTPKKVNFRSKGLSNEQYTVLKGIFIVKPYLKTKNPNEYLMVADRLGVPESKIRVWFQNRRSRNQEEVRGKRDVKIPVKAILDEVIESITDPLLFQAGDAHPTGLPLGPPDVHHSTPEPALHELKALRALVAGTASTPPLPAPPLPAPALLRRLAELIDNGAEAHTEAVDLFQYLSAWARATPRA